MYTSYVRTNPQRNNNALPRRAAPPRPALHARERSHKQRVAKGVRGVVSAVKSPRGCSLSNPTFPALHQSIKSMLPEWEQKQMEQAEERTSWGTARSGVDTPTHTQQRPRGRGERRSPCVQAATCAARQRKAGKHRRERRCVSCPPEKESRKLISSASSSTKRVPLLHVD